jgi:hypothetical protein
MRLNNYLIAGALSLFALKVSAQSGTATFNFTGGIQTFTVPCGIDTIFVQTWGAQGGSGANGNSSGGPTLGGAGGLGGYAEGWLAVNPGDVINVFVGGQGATPTGGFNGGANGGSQNAGGGGGATDVRVGGTAEANRVITAGGGGGGGRGGCESGTGITGGSGGSGGGGIGGDGIDAPTSGGSAGGGKGGNFGAVQGAAGGAGVGCSGFLGAAGSTALTGTGGTGGSGQACCCFSFGSIPGGGGGGGGQVGGGGGGGGSAGTTGCSGNDKGAGGGGGGGSSYTGGVLNGAVNPGIWLGNGMVTISWNKPIPVPQIVSAGAICVGDSTTLTLATMPSQINGGHWNAPGFTHGDSTQPTFTIYGTAAITGDVVCTWYTACGDSAMDTVSITVNPLPVVTFSTQSMACLADGAVTLSGSPSGGTFSGTAVTGNQFSPGTAGAGTHAITYTYTDSSSCSASVTDSITVDPCLGIAGVIPTGTIAVSPNPAVEFVTVSWNADAHVTSITVVDVTGKVVLTENAINSTTKQLNVSALPAGTYTISTIGDVTIVETFVKQ